jgi:hypothetical protein
MLHYSWKWRDMCVNRGSEFFSNHFVTLNKNMATIPREFERQGMVKIFNKKIKTRFPILFKRALDFHLMKAKGRV